MYHSTDYVAKNSCIWYAFAVIIYIQLFLCFAKTSTNFSSKNQIQIESIQGYMLKNITNNLSQEFKKISSDELGLPIIKDVYSRFKYTTTVQDVDKVVKKIASKLESKLNETFIILNRTRHLIENYTVYTNIPIQSAIMPCSFEEDNYKSFDLNSVNLNDSYSERPLSINRILDMQITSAKKLKSAIKQIYLLTAQDVSNSYNAPLSNCKNQDHLNLWKLYMQRTKSLPRNIMLLLDHGGSLSKQQFRIVKDVAKQMISVLNKEDKIGVLAISDEWSSPYLTEQCLMPNQMPPVSNSHTILPATEHNIYLINKFIHSLTKGNGVTNHSLGFQQALQTIKTSNISSNETIMLLYVSRGLLSSLTEAKTVLETIAYMFENIESSVIINTCAVIDESKPIMYETHFLRDVAQQNYTKYNINTSYDAQEGIMLSINSSQIVGLTVARFYDVLKYKHPRDFGLDVTLPVWDIVTEDLSVSFTIPCRINGEIGLLGLDLYFSDLVEDITYYVDYGGYTHAFIINTEGIAVMHPSYPRPIYTKEQPKFVDILHLEKVENFNIIRQQLLTKKEGSYLLKTHNSTFKYVWKRVHDWYVVCTVICEKENPPLRPYKVPWFSSDPTNMFVHHRLDIVPVNNLCRHLNQRATIDASTLYLSASSFQSPFSYISISASEEVSSLTIQSYMAFLKDNTRLLANPGLKEEIRDDVVALAHILDFFRVQHLSGPRAKYIVRRYITSPNGVMQMFPGVYIPPQIEPTRRSWYLRAVEHRYRTILTPPYLDAGGAGYIVTIAFATANVVTAIDVTFGYIYKLMLQEMPFCEKKNIKCFMMDDRGYLIYHPNLIDPNGHGPIEQQHIIHKESLVANDILNHKHFVKKMLCNNYANGTVQRYYRMNMSLSDVLVNVVHGEHCVKYQVNAVAGTNIFIGIVNATCELVATFCPCSMVDRLCLNCNRMEQKECECPCECPLNLDTCTHPNRTFIDNPLCSTLPEQNFPIIYKAMKTDMELKPCIPVMCETQLTYESCLGVLDCEWCQIDVDGETILTNPFCTAASMCFNGILGSVTPYGDANSGVSISEDLLGSTYSPVGPIIGSVVGVFLILGFLFFCYRSYNSPTVERFYLASAQDNQVRMSDFNMSDEFQELDNHQDKLLQDTNKREPISPYCVSTGYRRPLTAADSDHGYSTMTPHDESEHLSFAPVEIDSLEDECISDATSINTSVSSKQPKISCADSKNKIKKFPQLTDIQITTVPNRIMAPVTVHRNMELTQ